jgi:putative ABC transport system substrate-binding protein
MARPFLELSALDRRSFLGVVAVFAAPRAALAQPARKVYRIGVLLTSAASQLEHANRALDDGLRELGYVVGRDLILERRFADGQPERLPALAAELVRLKVDVIVTGSNPVIEAVKQATTTIPIVMGVSRDPVGSGFVASLARPGGNITGLANDPAPDIQAKNLELLKEAVPRVSRVALLWSPFPSGADSYRSVVESAARRLGLGFRAMAVRGPAEIEGAFAAMSRERVDGLVVLQDPVMLAARRDVVGLAARHRLPAVYALREFVDAGGLMSYGVNIAQQFRRAAVYVDKILKGARPGDLAVEQPTRFELAVNLKTAKALRLTIPPSILARADLMIE